MADNAREGHVAFDTVFTDLVRAETRLYNAVAERVKARAGVGAGRFEMLRYVRDHQGQGARVADVASTFAIGVGTTSKIADRLEKEGWLGAPPEPGEPALVPARADSGRRVGRVQDRARLAGGDPGDPRRGRYP